MLGSTLQHSKGAWKILVVNRKYGESIRIGDDIKIVILEDRGNQVKIGIDAPKDVTIS